jgi:membrane-bound lytic murein transglycosylase D
MGPVGVERLRRIETEVELDGLRNALLRLHALGPNPTGLTADERRLHDLFADDAAPDRFLAAADEKRLRAQRGLRERFAEGVRVSRRYLPEMERIFRAEGLPVELTRLPLIESCFNLEAYSKAGAAGIWQFMPATARLYMRVDGLVDERRDPIAATGAAAKFLREMYERLGSWPLAITAYNHGPRGVARAVSATGTTDIGRIVEDYGGTGFGFASRNFYAEFLAALDVERDYRTHFGDLPLDPPRQFREHRLRAPTGILQVARAAGTDRDEIARLNPALSDAVIAGRRPIPGGYRLRLPGPGTTELDGIQLARAETNVRPVRQGRVVRAAARAPARRGRPRVRSAALTYRVRAGQTLSHIARQHKVSVSALRSTNRLGKEALIRPGQVLKIPRTAT